MTFMEQNLDDWYERYENAIKSFDINKLSKEKESIMNSFYISWREFREKIRIICELENKKRLLLSK